MTSTMYEFRFTPSYQKKARKFFKKHPDLTDRYKKIMRLLQVDPFNDTLQIKKMSGRQDMYRLRLTIHARLVMEILITDKDITPIDIDMRENIY